MSQLVIVLIQFTRVGVLESFDLCFVGVLECLDLCLIAFDIFPKTFCLCLKLFPEI